MKLNNRIFLYIPNRVENDLFALCKGVSRAFQGERLPHSEALIEEENEETLRRNERKSGRVRKKLGNVPFLPPHPPRDKSLATP